MSFLTESFRALDDHDTSKVGINELASIGSQAMDPLITNTNDIEYRYISRHTVDHKTKFLVRFRVRVRVS